MLHVFCVRECNFSNKQRGVPSITMPVLQTLLSFSLINGHRARTFKHRYQCVVWTDCTSAIAGVVDGATIKAHGKLPALISNRTRSNRIIGRIYRCWPSLQSVQHGFRRIRPMGLVTADEDARPHISVPVSFCLWNVASRPFARSIQTSG